MSQPAERAGRATPFGTEADSADRPAVRPTPLLLQGQDYFVRAPSHTLDFQERMYDADMVAEERPDPAPCVVVLARAADMEINDLSLALAEHDIRMIRIDADRCVDVSLTVYTDAPLIEFQRWLLRPILVWRRHFDTSAIPADPTTVHGAYVREQWRAVSNWLSCRGDWEQINPIRETGHLDRMTQLSDAASAGLRVPRTAVTTLPGRNRPGGGRCIVKAAGHHMLEPEPGALRGLFPRPLELSRAEESLEPAPVVVQQHLDAEYELRVFVVGEQVIAYRVEKLDPAQLWVDPETVRVWRVDVPEDLSGRVLDLSRFWRLDVAAFDILVVDGDFVFLEVNVNCDWRWFEQRAESDAVSGAVHEWVRRRFDELVTSAPLVGHP